MLEDNRGPDKQQASGSSETAFPDSREEAATVEQLLNEKLSTRLQRELDGIATVSVMQPTEGEDQSKETIQIDVANRERWRSPECQRKFLPLIGSILQQTFCPKDADRPLSADELLQEYGESDERYMDRMILMADGQQVRGFVMLKQCKPTKTHTVPVLALQLISVEAGSRYAGTGKQLCELAHRSFPNAAVVGATHTPAAVKVLIKNRVSGYSVYFCGYRNGDESLQLSEQEKLLLEEAEESYRDILRTDYDGFLQSIDQSGLPPHCVTYGKESIVWGDEHRWSDGDASPVAKTFGKLRQWVYSHGRENEGIYGMITMLPERDFLEK